MLDLECHVNIFRQLYDKNMVSNITHTNNYSKALAPQKPLYTDRVKS